MKRLLLDTEALIWWDKDDRKLGGKARRAIQEADEVRVSAASAWEIVIKQALGKLRTTRRPGTAVSEAGFDSLPITFEHAEAVGTIPMHHRDPFDRLIIAAALIDGYTIVTSDDKFWLYALPLLDARD